MMSSCRMYVIRAVVVALALCPALALAQGPVVTEIVYDDFSGGEAGYAAKWSVPFYWVAGETLTSDGGALVRDFTAETAHFEISEFTAGSDFLFFDHIKYLATSNQAFGIPEHGSISFYMDVDGTTLGTVPDLVMEANRLSDGEPVSYELLEAQQACVTLHMLNFHETGQLFDWLITTDKAYALTERLFDPAGIDDAYTQIAGVFEYTPGMNEFGIRYSRQPGKGADKVEWLINGVVVAKNHSVGVPLDVQAPGKYKRSPLVYPSLGPGEVLKNEMETMIIGHGIFSLLDVFPFGQAPAGFPDDPSVSIPIGFGSATPPVNGVVSTRLFGQGAIVDFDNVRVVIEEK